MRNPFRTWKERRRVRTRALALRSPFESDQWQRRLAIRRALYAEQRGVCALCGTALRWRRDGRGSRQHPLGATLDHLLPRALGGPDDPLNLRLTQRACNVARDVRPALDGGAAW